MQQEELQLDLFRKKKKKGGFLKRILKLGTSLGVIPGGTTVEALVAKGASGAMKKGKKKKKKSRKAETEEGGTREVPPVEEEEVEVASRPGRGKLPKKKHAYQPEEPEVEEEVEGEWVEEEEVEEEEEEEEAEEEDAEPAGQEVPSGDVETGDMYNVGNTLVVGGGILKASQVARQQRRRARAKLRELREQRRLALGRNRTMLDESLLLAETQPGNPSAAESVSELENNRALLLSELLQIVRADEALRAEQQQFNEPVMSADGDEESDQFEGEGQEDLIPQQEHVRDTWEYRPVS